MNLEKNIVVVGGGLVGSLLAVMLGQRGFRVEVYEKRPDMRRTKIPAGRSINLALAKRGIAGLTAAGLMDDVEPLLIPMRGRMLHPLHGELEFSPYGQRPHEVIYSVSRGLLNMTMLNESEKSKNVSYRFEHECVAVDLKQNSIELLDHRSGQRLNKKFDILLGTDGANSVIRDSVVSSAGGHWRTDWLDHDYKELSIPAGPDGTYQIDKNSLHIWPRHGFMVIALPNLDGSFTVTLFLNKSGNVSFERLHDPPQVAKFFQQYFPDACQLIPELTDDFFSNPTGVLGTVRCSQWTNGSNALLLGDSAHAIVPFHGQGMNAGFEDCEVLMELLDRNQNDWPNVMRDFQTARMENANAIADMALENYITMRDSVLDQRFQLKKELGFELERRHPQRFIPRYSMVMFHQIPYAVAKQRGIIQEKLLDDVIGSAQDLKNIDLDRADNLIQQRLPPLLIPD